MGSVHLRNETNVSWLVSSLLTMSHVLVVSSAETHHGCASPSRQTNSGLWGQAVPSPPSHTCIATLCLPSLPWPHHSLCVTPPYVTKRLQNQRHVSSQRDTSGDGTPSTMAPKLLYTFLSAWQNTDGAVPDLRSFFPLLGLAGHREQREGILT